MVFEFGDEFVGIQVFNVIFIYKAPKFYENRIRAIKVGGVEVSWHIYVVKLPHVSLRRKWHKLEISPGISVFFIDTSYRR